MDDWVLIREEFGTLTTLGKLFHKDQKLGYILEPTVRGKNIKVPGLTAIPEGIYPMKEYTEGRHDYPVILLEDVANFSYIEIHIGNFWADTDGCLLPGNDYQSYQYPVKTIQGHTKHINEFFVTDSTDCYMNKILPAFRNGGDNQHIEIASCII